MNTIAMPYDGGGGYAVNPSIVFNSLRAFDVARPSVKSYTYTLGRGCRRSAPWTSLAPRWVRLARSSRPLPASARKRGPGRAFRRADTRAKVSAVGGTDLMRIDAEKRRPLPAAHRAIAGRDRRPGPFRPWRAGDPRGRDDRGASACFGPDVQEDLVPGRVQRLVGNRRAVSEYPIDLQPGQLRADVFGLALEQSAGADRAQMGLAGRVNAASARQISLRRLHSSTRLHCGG